MLMIKYWPLSYPANIVDCGTNPRSLKKHFKQDIHVRYLGIQCSYYSKEDFIINFQNSMIF